MPKIRLDRHLAINSRKQGKSYAEISKELGIPESTLGYWFRGNLWSEEIKTNLIGKARILATPKLRLMSKANKKKWDEIHLQQQDEAKRDFPLLVKKPLFIAGLMLYWGEGDKVIKNGIVRLANSDPEMIKIFHFFLNKVLKIPKEKIIIKLTLYPDLEEVIYKKFWSKAINIPLTQFRTSVVIEGKHPSRRLSYGVCSIEVYSRKLKEKIFTWLKLYQQYFSQKDIDGIMPEVSRG